MEEKMRGHRSPNENGSIMKKEEWRERETHEKRM